LGHSDGIFRLDGQVAIVTGGASGIGQAIAEMFAAYGARVHILDVNQQLAESVAAKIRNLQGAAAAHGCDVSSQREVERVFDEIISQEAVDILVNSAGIPMIGKLEETSEADFDRTYQVNIKGTYNCMLACIEHMKARGCGVILNMASIAGWAGLPDRFAYSMTKGAVVAMTYSVARDYEGFCNWDTKLTNYCAARQGPGRDLVREYVEAARAEGLRVGFYYSLMDWHHPDGARCATDEEARKRFVEYTHGLIRELLTNYGKIDVLWYDVRWPLNADQWESEKMNKMVFELQPDIIVNNRNGLPGDFATPEQRIEAAKDKAWEACMTLNDSWGYQHADDNWKTSKQVIRNLISCVRDEGNYLLNIGPKADGSIPEESIRVLSEVGKWMEKNSEAIYASETCQVRRNNYASFTRKGSTLYMHVHYWPGDTVAMSGLKTTVKSARLLATNKKVEFQQDQYRIRITGLPSEAPDHPVTTIAMECESEPTQDSIFVRKEKPREGG
jgi:alpha-L-fucosidase